MSEKPAVAISAARLPGLDGLRGIACLMVFLYHLRWHARPSDDSPLRLPFAGFEIEPLLTRFDCGVAIFFVLSGLLLSVPFWRSILDDTPFPNVRQFYWRRVCRILPAYYVILAVAYLLRPGTYTLYGFLDFALHAAFLQNFADYSYHSVLGVLWTIGIELQFYLLLPIIMAALSWLCRKGGIAFALGTLIVGTWLIGLVADSTARALEPSVPDRILAADGAIIASGTIFSYLRLFAFGIVAGWAVLTWKCRARTGDIICAISITGIALLIVVGREAEWRIAKLHGWPLNAFLIATLAAAIPHSGLFATALSTRAFAIAGSISYGVYLWHELILRAVFGGTLPNILKGWPLFLAGGLIALVVTALIAGASWLLIERRALKSPYPFRA